MGHFARNCPKPRENTNIARERAKPKIRQFDGFW